MYVSRKVPLTTRSKKEKPNKSLRFIFLRFQEEASQQQRSFITKTTNSAIAQAICSAKVRILTCFFFLSSCGTGPNTLVPIGSPCLLSRTTALSSNLTSLPSQRPLCMAARTTTPYTTSPFFTFPLAWASFTDAIIVSPNLAPLFPFNACMHITRFAPELSTTLRLVLICMKVLICWDKKLLHAISCIGGLNKPVELPMHRTNEQPTICLVFSPHVSHEN